MDEGFQKWQHTKTDHTHSITSCLHNDSGTEALLSVATALALSHKKGASKFTITTR